jgi:sugar lactone lactonase YvrE
MRHLKLIVCAVIMLFISGVASAQQDIINNYAGGGPNNVPATSAPAVYPAGVAIDGSGNLYFSTEYTNQHRVFKVSPTGTLTVLAGNGFPGYSGDGGAATQAQLYNPQGLAVDHAGNVFIADQSNCAVREVNASTGVITTVAGEPAVSCGYNADSVPATSSYLNQPLGVAIDKNGNLFIADEGNQRIRMVSCATVTSTGGTCSPNASQTTGDIYTVAGTGTPVFNGNGEPATTANLYNPYDVTTDAAGNLYIADTYDQLVRRVACGTGISGCTPPSGETSGHIYGIAGTGATVGNPGTCGYNNDGITAASAELCYPTSLSIDNSGNLFIADSSNFRIREVSCVTTTSSGGTCTASAGQTVAKIYTVAGNGSPGYNGDMQLATSADIYYVYGVAVDSAGDLFLADYNNYRIREVPCDVSTLTCTPPSGDLAQDIYTVAGNGTYAFFGEGIAATGSILNTPTGTVSDSLGNIYIADYRNCVVREIDALTGIITSFAGNYSLGCGYSGDGGPATSAQLYYPYHLGIDSSNNVYITDPGYCVIREVSGGDINTVVGNGSCGYSGDGGAATGAQLSTPYGVTFDGNGNMYIADYGNNLIRKVSGGIITTFAGNYLLGAGFSGDGGPATNAQINGPNDVATDAAGNVYIDDYGNTRIRKIDTTGRISTFAGNGSVGFQGDGGLAVETSLYYPQSVAVDSAGDVLIADYDNERIRLVDGAGYIHTVAGNGTNSFFGIDVLATTAEISQPQGIGTDPAGNIYVSDTGNDLVRQVSALAELNSSPSSVVFETQQVGTSSPAATVTLASAGPLTISSITPSANFTELDDCPSSLSNGATCTVDVYFAPTSSGIIKGTLIIADNAFFNNPLVVSLQGTATGLIISPNPLAFGVVMDGSPATLSVTVTGSTIYAATSATLSGDTTDYSIASNTCTGTKSSCAIGITFNPGTVGLHKATLAIHDSDPTSAQLVPITGSGCVSGCSSAYETFTPSSITFPAETIKLTSAATKVTFNNNNTNSLTITKPVATAGFKLNTTGLTGSVCSITASTVVAAGGSCSFNVTFSPTVSGTTSGTVKTTFPNDGHGNTSLSLPVSGVGVPVSFTPNPIAFKPQLLNTASTNTKVTFKNVGTVTLTLTGLTPSPSNYTINYTGINSGGCNTVTTLAANAMCTFNVAFNPGATLGSIPGTVTASFMGDPNGVTQDVVNVTGIGTAVKLTGGLAFGTVTGGTSKILSVTVTNEGSTAVTFSTPTITGTAAAQYSVVAYTTGPPAYSTCLNPGLMLAQNATCTVSVQFNSPAGSGGAANPADLNIFDSDPASPQVVVASGKD